MYRPADCHTFIEPGTTSLRRRVGKLLARVFVRGWVSIILSALIYLASLGFTQPVRADPEQAKPVSINNVEDGHHPFADAQLEALKAYAQQIGPERSERVNMSQSPHPHFDDADLAVLHQYARQAGSERAEPASVSSDPHPHYLADPDFAALRDYAQQVGMEGTNSAGVPRVRVAEAESAFDALRDFLRKREQPPSSAPDSTPRESPRQLRPAAPAPRPAAPPRHDRPIVDAHFLGARTCLFCHAPQAASFDKTLMGRINRTTHKGRLDCESCHGPGSTHVQAIGCAACHGEGGISSKPGIPSLVGQDPQYLVPAMKAYATGQRRQELKKLIFSGMGEAELHDLAAY
jgi:hypothetical protein